MLVKPAIPMLFAFFILGCIGSPTSSRIHIDLDINIDGSTVQNSESIPFDFAPSANVFADETILKNDGYLCWIISQPAFTKPCCQKLGGTYPVKTKKGDNACFRAVSNKTARTEWEAWAKKYVGEGAEWACEFKAA